MQNYNRIINFVFIRWFGRDIVASYHASSTMAAIRPCIFETNRRNDARRWFSGSPRLQWLTCSHPIRWIWRQSERTRWHPSSSEGWIFSKFSPSLAKESQTNAFLFEAYRWFTGPNHKCDHQIKLIEMHSSKRQKKRNSFDGRKANKRESSSKTNSKKQASETSAVEPSKPAQNEIESIWFVQLFQLNEGWNWKIHSMLIRHDMVLPFQFGRSQSSRIARG